MIKPITCRFSLLFLLFLAANQQGLSQPKKVLETGFVGNFWRFSNCWASSQYFVLGYPSSYTSKTHLYSLETGKKISEQENIQTWNVQKGQNGDYLLGLDEIKDSIAVFSIGDHGIVPAFYFSKQDTNQTPLFERSAENSFSSVFYYDSAFYITDGTKQGTELIYETKERIWRFFSNGDYLYFHYTSPAQHFVKIHIPSKKVESFLLEDLAPPGKYYGIFHPTDNRYFLVSLQDSFASEYYDFGILDVVSGNFFELDAGLNPIERGPSYVNYSQYPVLVEDKIYFFGETIVKGYQFKFSVYEADLQTRQIRRIRGEFPPVTDGHRPRLHSSKNGLIILGELDKEGAEPYTIRNSKIEVLYDIFPGHSSSLEELGMVGLPGSEHDRFPNFSDGERSYFVANHPAVGRELFCSDGTSQGTFLLGDALNGVRGLGHGRIFESTDEELFFIHELESRDYELYHFPKNHRQELETRPENQWNRIFGFGSDRVNSFNVKITKRARTSIREDGKIVVFQDGLDLEYPWMAYSEFDSVQRSPGQEYPYSGGIIHILDSNGFVEKMISSKGYENKSELGVDPRTGSMVLAMQYGQDSSYIGDRVINNEEGFSLTGFDRDGHEKWFRKFRGQDIHPLKILVEDGKIFLLGWYFGSYLELGKEVLENKYSPYSFIAAFDSIGHPLWAKNIRIDSFSHWSQLGNLAYDSKAKRVFSFINESSYSWWSSCGYSDWHFAINAFDASNGDSLWQTGFKTGGLSRFPGFDIGTAGELIIGGDFTSSITLEKQKITPLPKTQGGCPQSSILIFYESETGELIKTIDQESESVKMLRGIYKPDNGIYTLSLVRKSERDYPFGPLHSSSYKMELDLLSENGKLIGSKEFELAANSRQGDENEIGAEIHPVGKRSVLITLSFQNQFQLGFDTLVSFPSAGFNTKSFVLAKRTGIPYSEFNTSNFYSFESSFIVFPNPLSSNELNIIIKNGEQDNFEKAALFSITGRKIGEWVLRKDEFEQRIQFNGKPEAGLYILKLSGTKSESVKLVIQ